VNGENDTGTKSGSNRYGRRRIVIGLEAVTVEPIDRCELVELGSEKGVRDKGLHKEDLVDWAHVQQAKAVPDLVDHHIDEIVVNGRRKIDPVVEEIVVRVNQHVATVREVVAGEDAAVSVDGVATYSHVRSDTERATVGRHRHTVVVWLVDEREA
jgi:hypothetical protein